MKRYVSVVTLILVFLCFCLFPSNARGQTSERPDKDVLRGFAGSRNFLDLTPEQESKLGELRKMRMEKRREFQKNMVALQEEIRKLMKDPEANEKEIIGLYDKVAKLRSSQFSEFVQFRKEMKKIFTPEQLEKLEKLESRITQRRGAIRGGFLAQRGFARAGRFAHRGMMLGFERRGRNFRGRWFMNRWRRWR
ncbi:MAG: Spy/CpxP family protein refolding chaperone [Candidatus Aminicenantes bacterium]|nr:Spy/CpxP family protein refolding chaperone [Candidatus Aminicenantes bacterium]